jgi:hypothetical protein
MIEEMSPPGPEFGRSLPRLLILKGRNACNCARDDRFSRPIPDDAGVREGVKEAEGAGVFVGPGVGELVGA